ncbi:hypothetical protein BKA64DRAFT_93223 [Cadophora sp. MPI-SDFR-AT-0126]|nr:hypothetical protein BKA64DRAFT_93223 [Leotiomycetes sp. MPI-SDFR-AT-0126]
MLVEWYRGRPDTNRTATEYLIYGSICTNSYQIGDPELSGGESIEPDVHSTFFPLYDQFYNNGVLDYLHLQDLVSAECSFHKTRASYLSLLLRYPANALGLGCGDITIAILRRSFSNLQRLLPKDNPHETPETGRASELDVTELALGWKEGLEYTVSIGLNVLSAIELAFTRDDVASLTILLTSPTAIFSHALRPGIFKSAAKSSNLVIHKLVVNEFKRRRAFLNSLALQVYTIEEQNDNTVMAGGLLEDNFEQVYHLLRRSDSHVS